MVHQQRIGVFAATMMLALCDMCACFAFGNRFEAKTKTRPNFCRLSRAQMAAATHEHSPGGLKAAGGALIAGAQSTHGSKEQQQLIQLAGQALIDAGESWTVDWTEVTCSLAEASKAFAKLSLKDETAADLYGCVAQELEDASNISGCTSIGPSSSVPNLEAVRDAFVDLAKLDKTPCSSEAFLEASYAIDKLIEGLD